MDRKKICHIIELSRWLAVIIGFQLAFWIGKNPAEQFTIITLWIVVPVAGLTGIESLFLGKFAAEITGYTYSAGYQRQSAINNLALAITALLLLIFQWGTYAQATVMTTLLLFLLLSSANHAWSAFREGNHGLQNLMRPFLTSILLVAILPMLIRALAFVK